MRRRVLTLLRNAATPHPLAPIRLHRAPTQRPAGVTPPQAAATAAAEAPEAEVVAVGVATVEVAVGAAAHVEAEAVRLPTLVPEF